MHAVPSHELPDPHWDLFEFDKLGHAAMFAILAFSLGNGFNKQTKFFRLKSNYFVIILSVSLTYGVILETLQFSTFVGRTFQTDDLVADLIGTLMGLLALKILYGKLLKLT